MLYLCRAWDAPHTVRITPFVQNALMFLLKKCIRTTKRGKHTAVPFASFFRSYSKLVAKLV